MFHVFKMKNDEQNQISINIGMSLDKVYKTVVVYKKIHYHSLMKGEGIWM